MKSLEPSAVEYSKNTLDDKLRATRSNGSLYELLFWHYQNNFSAV